jgi:gas vesicle structural protein
LSSHDGHLTRTPHPTSLYDVLDLTLDKGLVIDVYARASLLGLELLAIDARVVVASVDTYLRFAEAVNRLDLDETGAPGLPELAAGMVEDAYEAGARSKTRAKLESVKEKVQETVEEAKETIADVLRPGDERSS